MPGARVGSASVALSPRLNGVLSEPIELGPVSDTDIAEVVRRRIAAFAMSQDAFAPVSADGFEHLHRVLNRNLRDALKFCEDFAFWLADQGEQPEATE